MIFSPLYVTGYASAGLFGSRIIRLKEEHRRDDCQYDRYADDWNEERNAGYDER